MKVVISESQYKRLIETEKQKVVLKKSTMGLNESKIEKFIQKIIDKALEDIRDSTEEMGLGEMDELNEINSVDKIKVTNVVKDKVFVIHVDLYVNTDRDDFDNIINEIEYKVGRFLGNVEIMVDNIIDTRTFGPGIDW
jgi:ribonucleotide reductase beta subunit family protein with ferritin-like domain